MTNLEQQLRDTYAERLGALDPAVGDVAAARRTGARMRTRRRLAVAAATVAVVVVAAGGSLVGSGRLSIGPSGDTGHWHELPAAPLSPRANAQTVWTGAEVIVLGGEQHPCPPNADCANVPDDLRDGAAYNPETDSWRRISTAPVPVGPGDRLVAADGVVVLRHAQGHGSRWFTYEPDHNRWSRVNGAPSGLGDLPSAIGSRVYVTAGRRVAVYDVSGSGWTLLPPDDLEPPLAQRRVTATGVGPVVTGVDSTRPQDGSGSKPLLVLADLWDGSSWHRMPPSEQLANNEFWWTGTRMVDPEPFRLDGGEVNGWGRSYPMGGTLDPATGTWGSLPEALVDPPQGNSRGLSVSAAGGPWFAVLGQAYDDRTGQVFRLGRPTDAPDYGLAAAWAGDRLLVFGGADSSRGYSGDAVTNRAWLWTP